MVTTIFGGITATESRREWKLAARRVLVVASEETTANPSYRPWSEISITFSRADQWEDIPYIGRFSLVLDATIKKVLFRKVLVDGGSALNLLFVRSPKGVGPWDNRSHALRLLLLGRGTWQGIQTTWGNYPTSIVRHGKQLSRRAHQLLHRRLQHRLPCHTWSASSGQVHGCTVPHYAYLVLKMPSPAGVLALWANLSITYACETESLALAEATDLSI